MRLHNIFGGEAPSINVPQGTPAPSPMSDNTDIYNPNTQDTSRLRDLVDSYPEHEKHSVMRRIAAAVVGAGYGPNAAQEFLDSPYQRQVQDWKNKVQPTESLATQERFANTNERMARTSERTLGIRQQELEVRKARAAAYIMKQSNPNQKFDVDKMGMLIALDPATGTAKYVLDEDGQPVHSSKLSDEDKINLQIQGRLQGIRATGDEARKTEGVRHAGDMSEISARGEQARQTQKEKPLAESVKGSLPSQEKIALQNRASKARIEHPEWAPFITIENGYVNVKPPSTSRFFNRGPSPEVYKNIQEYLSGNSAPITTTTNTTNTPANASSIKVGDEVGLEHKEESTVPVFDIATGKQVATIPSSAVKDLNTTKYRAGK